MESYPEDLLVGVFPLVFVVNAIFDPNDVDKPESPPSTGDIDISSAAVSPKNRSDFDRFLDAMAGSLAEENDDADESIPLEFPSILPTEAPSSTRNVSLFRPDDDELDESTDDDYILDADDDAYYNNPGSNNTGGSPVKRRTSSSSNSMRLYAGFGLTRKSPTGAGAHSSSNTSYAKALQQGQGFFQRARIVSISSKHGFPPSKDPEGTKSIVFALKQARASQQKAKEIFSARPIQGILPAGWLEKHVYALPSVVLVVVKLARSDQKSQDADLLKTVENLHHSLVPKRPCKIHVVCLVDDEIAVAQAQQWSLDVSRQIVDSNPNIQTDSHKITLLRGGKDLRSGTDGFPTSVALKRLHRSVRDSSLLYYLGQARRTKEKLAKLSDGGKKRLSTARQRVQPPKELLPLAIRYCFKIAMYYEFQLKYEKSLKFMAEAYRYARCYYHHLIRLSTIESGPGNNTDDKKLLDASEERKVSISTGDIDEMEVSITSPAAQGGSGDGAEWSTGIPIPPSDMAHQCLAVADWLNFKLLQAGFGSHTEGGLLAADGQWRQHSRVFCARRFLGGHPIMSEEWFFCCHVAHQRLVMSQLVERHPPKALGDLGNEYDEVLLRCAPWRAYEAAAEALLKAGVSVAKAAARGNGRSTATEDPKDDSRAPFLGGLKNDGLVLLLDKESRKDHKGKALELVFRAISMFEHEWGKEKLKDAEDQFPHRPWGRFGARLYYLAGGILVSNKQYAGAATHLEQAVKFSAGWSGIEIAVRRLLAECYEKNSPASLGEDKSNKTIAAVTMETCFQSKMQPAKLLRFLGSCSEAIKTPSIPWKCECFDEFDNRLPFSFSVSFPGKSHATSGDTVSATVFLKSNLEYSIVLESVCLMSMAGQINVPMSDIAENGKSNVLIGPNGDVVFSTQIILPKDLDDIIVDETTTGSDKPSKTSYTKSARPRTAGITAAAGARLVSEGIFFKKARNSNAQWSLNFLGGKPLRCDTIQLILRPLVQNSSGGSGSQKIKPIELIIEKKKPKTPANIKRTPFEEDNYIASAWCRPLHFPTPSGPRCLRVLGPLSGMEITNLTQAVSDGRAIEGTVNRICLKLQAGSEEACSEIKIKVSCSTTLVIEDGTTKNLSAEESVSTNSVSMKNPDVRTPVLVAESSKVNSPTSTEFGYDIPSGWELAGSGQESKDECVPHGSALACGEATYAFFELFRPTALTPGGVSKASICQTDFEVIVSYSQERDRREQDLGDQKEGNKDDKISEIVSQKFSGSVLWTPPMIASFQCGERNSSPCGSRHPSNLTDDARPSDTSVFTDIPIVDGERVSIRSCLKANLHLDGCGFEVEKIRFEDGEDAEMPCQLAAASASDCADSKVLFQPQEDDPSRWLKNKSKLSFVYSVQVDMKNKNRSATFPLGIIAVDWLPRQIELPDEVTCHVGEEAKAHGPLALSSPRPVKFLGPMCYIEKAPFKTTFKCFPSVPKVSVPFEVNYSITNDTSAHQQLSVVLDGIQKGLETHQDILVCGLVKGDLRLAPYETQILSYTAIATKPGMTTLPFVGVSSCRYNSWVVYERAENARPLCILP